MNIDVHRYYDEDAREDYVQLTAHDWHSNMTDLIKIMQEGGGEYNDFKKVVDIAERVGGAASFLDKAKEQGLFDDFAMIDHILNQDDNELYWLDSKIRLFELTPSYFERFTERYGVSNLLSRGFIPNLIDACSLEPSEGLRRLLDLVLQEGVYESSSQALREVVNDFWNDTDMPMRTFLREYAQEKGLENNFFASLLS